MIVDFLRSNRSFRQRNNCDTVNALESSVPVSYTHLSFSQFRNAVLGDASVMPIEEGKKDVNIGLILGLSIACLLYTSIKAGRFLSSLQPLYISGSHGKSILWKNHNRCHSQAGKDVYKRQQHRFHKQVLCLPHILSYL